MFAQYLLIFLIQANMKSKTFTRTGFEPTNLAFRALFVCESWLYAIIVIVKSILDEPNMEKCVRTCIIIIFFHIEIVTT